MTLRQIVCGLRGHTTVLTFGDRAMRLTCTHCQHQTPGWKMFDRAPRQRFAGDAQHHALKPLRLLRKRA